jgi:hypothetical protein
MFDDRILSVINIVIKPFWGGFLAHVVYLQLLTRTRIEFCHHICHLSLRGLFRGDFINVIKYGYGIPYTQFLGGRVGISDEKIQSVSL